MGRTNIGGGINTSDATAVVADILAGKTAYVNKQKLTGTMTNQGSKTFTPSNVTQTTGAGYYSGITVNPQTGVDINGIIEEYTVASGGNVSAGDFVKYMNEYGTDTQLSTTSSTGNAISAVALNDSKIFIAYSYKNGNNYFLYGMICTINGTTITAGTDIQLSSVANSGYAISAVALNETKVFIAHSYGNYTNLYGMICTINGTTITTGTDTQLSTTSSTGTVISTVVLNESKVFIAHSYGYSNSLYVMICTISGTTITTGTDTQLGTIPAAASTNISVVALNQTKVFIAHQYDTNNRYLYGIVCTISGTTITAGTDTQLSTTAYTGLYISVVALNQTKIFIAHQYDNSNRYLYGMICTISGTTITKGTDTQLSTSPYTAVYVSTVALSESKVFIAHYSDNSNYYYYGMECVISGTNITVKSDTRLSPTTYSGRFKSLVKLNNTKMIIVYPGDYYVYGIRFNIGVIDKTISSGDIIGVAKTSATAENTAQVYVPNV